jgi:hypothetical protein
MVKFDPSNAECLVFVYKQGLLSMLAHDLRLQVTDFCLDVDEASRTLTARARASSLRVDCAMRDGAEAEKPLSAGDLKTIESVIVKDVLHSDKYPEIRFLSTCIRRLREEGLKAALEWRDGPFRDFRGARTTAPKERPVAGTESEGQPKNPDRAS